MNTTLPGRADRVCDQFPNVFGDLDGLLRCSGFEVCWRHAGIPPQRAAPTRSTASIHPSPSIGGQMWNCWTLEWSERWIPMSRSSMSPETPSSKRLGSLRDELGYPATGDAGCSQVQCPERRMVFDENSQSVIGHSRSGEVQVCKGQVSEL